MNYEEIVLLCLPAPVKTQFNMTGIVQTYFAG